jgi:serine/threonine protein kinase
MTEDLELTCDLTSEHTEDLAPVSAEATPAPAVRKAPPTRPARERVTRHTSIARAPAPAENEVPPASPPIVDRVAAPVVEPAVDEKTARRIEPGVILHDRFLIERQLGAGGHCLVFCARDMHPVAGASSQVRIAIKTPHPDRADSAKDLARLRREHECLKALSHPNIVKSHELYCDDRECFMTMELLDGRTLASLQREWMPFPAALAYRVIEATGRALLHAHERGVVHGDFTPGNVIITSDEQIKVLDFGSGVIAGSRDEEHAAAGTRAYASPEVLSGLPPEPRDDLYSFACLAYELLVGRHPFDRKSSLEAKERALTPPRSGSLAAPQWFALVAALAWKRNDRSISLDALLKTLQESKTVTLRPIAPPNVNHSFTSQAIAAARALPEQPLSEDIWPKRNWGWLLFAAIVVVMVLLWFR